MQTKEQRGILGVSRTVFLLGIVSLLTDVSSEMLVPIVPQFVAFVLGGSGQAVGLIEGIAESTASLLRVYAGYLADKFGRPKLLTMLGYGLSALSKPFFIFASSWHCVLGIRFADRFGKGIRSAPRDVLIADACDESCRGRAFGLHRAMDATGAMLGPLAVLLIVWLLAGGHAHHGLAGVSRQVYTWVFVAAAIPAALGWLVLAIFVPERAKAPGGKPPELRLSALDRRFKVFLAIVTLFAIGNSSDAFLILRARGAHVGFVELLWVYAAFNAFSALVSLRSGVISDRIGRRPVIIAGWLVFAVVYFGFARVSTSAGVWFWFLIYGAYYGMTEGMLRAYAVDLAPPQLRGTAVGAYFTFTGAALLPASLIAGFLWDRVGHAAPFYYGSATALAAALLLGIFVRPSAGQ